MVALLRGINVGGRAMVGMAALRAVAERLGYANVRTHLQSGNLLVDTDASAGAVAAAIEGALLTELGMSVRVITRTPLELQDVVRNDPFGEAATGPSRHMVVFLSQSLPQERVDAVAGRSFEPDVFRVIGREIHVWLPGGVIGSRLMSALSEKRLGVVATTRNWNTVAALARMSSQPG